MHPVRGVEDSAPTIEAAQDGATHSVSRKVDDGLLRDLPDCLVDGFQVRWHAGDCEQKS